MSGLVKGIPPLAGALFKPCGVCRILASRRDLPTVANAAARGRAGIDEADKPQVMKRQADLPAPALRPVGSADRRAVMMSGGRKPVQDGVRVRLPADTTWDGLAAMSPGEIRARAPAGRIPAAAARQAGDRRAGASGPADRQIRRWRAQPAALVDMDLPEHLRPEFPRRSF